MAVQEDILALRRTVESINRLAVATAAQQGKITTELQTMKQEIKATRQSAERALQMCDALVARLDALEKAAG